MAGLLFAPSWNFCDKTQTLYESFDNSAKNLILPQMYLERCHKSKTYQYTASKKASDAVRSFPRVKVWPITSSFGQHGTGSLLDPKQVPNETSETFPHFVTSDGIWNPSRNSCVVKTSNVPANTDTTRRLLVSVLRTEQSPRP